MPTKTDLEAFRVAVTGGTSGLGLALVRLLAARGARVAFVARTASAVERTARETGALGIVGDVGRKDDIYPIALQITGRLGGLDVLVNNASSLGPTPLALLADTECEDLEQAIAVNLVGPFRLTKALFGALAASAREGRGALVINISSDAAIGAYPGWGAYGASKAALRHLTAVWAEEAKDHRVRFLSIDPGDMDTPLHALAVPDADPSGLKRPEDSAAEIVDAMLAAWPRRAAPASGRSHDGSRPPRRGIRPALRRRCGWKDAPSAALRARIDVRAGRPHRRQRRRHLAGEPARHARFARRRNRGAACGMGGIPRSDPVRRRRVRGGRSPHAHGRPGAPADPRTGRPSLPRAACGGGRVPVRPSAPSEPAFPRRARRRARRAGPARAADPIRACPRAARSLGRLDEDRRRPDRVRAALGGICARLAHARRLAAARRSPRHDHARRRDLLAGIRRSICGSPSTSPTASPRRARRRSSGRGRTATASSPSGRAWSARSNSAADAQGRVRAGEGVARGRIGRGTRLRVVDAILTSIHQPGESHFELLRAFADDAALNGIAAALAEHGFRDHEFGDSMLIERRPRVLRP